MPARKRRGRPRKSLISEDPDVQDDREGASPRDDDADDDVGAEVGRPTHASGGGRHSRDDDDGSDLVELFQRNARLYGR